MAAEADEAKPKLMFLCTGNAARSVMAKVITQSRSDLFELSGAGTHAIENCPMGNYTRKALASIRLEDRTHRSRQLNPYNADEVDLIIAMATDHVLYVRRNHPEVAHKTATFKRLVRDLGKVGVRGQEERSGDAEIGGSGVRDGLGVKGEGDIESSQVSEGSLVSESLRETLKSRIAEMRLAEVQLERWEEIGDPGAGDQPIFMSSLEEIDALVDSFLDLFAHSRSSENTGEISV